MALQDATHRVQAVESALSQAFLPAPEPLAVALDAYHAALATDLGAPLDLAADCLTVTADGVDALIERGALHEALRVNGGQVRGEIIEYLARRVVREFTPMLDPIADKFADQFDAEAANFVGHLAVLPDTHLLDNLEYLSRRGSLAHWEEARMAAQVLEFLAGARNSIADLGYISGLPAVVDVRTRFCDIDTPETYDTLTLDKVNGFGSWPTLARNPGVKLRWVKPSEQRDMVARIEGARPTKANRQRVKA